MNLLPQGALVILGADVRRGLIDEPSEVARRLVEAADSA